MAFMDNLLKSESYTYVIFRYLARLVIQIIIKNSFIHSFIFSLVVLVNVFATDIAILPNHVMAV